MRLREAAVRLRALLAAGTRIGAVLVAGDEGVLVANRLPGGLPVIDQVDADAAAACQLSELLDVPVHSPVTEPAAARFGALTTPGARQDAVVADLGAGTVDMIGPRSSVVAAGACELLTAAVAEMLGIPRAAADWVKRGPCVRVDGGQRFEAEDGTRGFLDIPAQVLVVGGPAGDEELLSVIARSLPDRVAVGRGAVGGTCAGEPLGHRYAVALGLALA